MPACSKLAVEACVAARCDFRGGFRECAEGAWALAAGVVARTIADIEPQHLPTVNQRRACQHEQGDKSDLMRVRNCAIDNLHQNHYPLKDPEPIAVNQFIDRRARLAAALGEVEVDAFALEPGYTFQYYGNISQTD
jgi:hypothetical protein